MTSSSKMRIIFRYVSNLGSSVVCVRSLDTDVVSGARTFARRLVEAVGSAQEEEPAQL